MICGWDMWICPSGVVLTFHLKYVLGYPGFEVLYFFLRTVNISLMLGWFGDMGRKSSILTAMRMGAPLWNLWNTQGSLLL